MAPHSPINRLEALLADEPLADPRAFRWVEAGVSGLARSRDWDVVALVEVPELAEAALEELRFGVLADGTLVGDDATAAGREVLERLAGRLREAVRAPFEVVAARQTRDEWSLAARELRIEEVELEELDVTELVVAVGPDGLRTLLVDGEEPIAMTDELENAAARLDAIGRKRSRSFVVRARHTVGDRFAISVDPL
jgi:hypothetical protein